MRLGLFILLFLVSFWSIGQGLEPSQIQGAPKLNDILQAKNMYIDEYGDTLYIYQHTSIDGLITSTDSIYVRNDTIFLRDGSGFAKVPQVGGGSPQDLFPHSTGFILSNPTIPLQDTVIFQYTSSVIGTPPSGCNCGILDIPNLQTALDGKALISHTHTIANITGLQAALDGKAATSHTHTIANVTGLQTAIDGKEASFAKGNIVQGTGVTLTGTLTNRLVGSGDVTINASGGGGSLTLDEAVAASVNLSTTNATLSDLSLVAGTYLINAFSSVFENQIVGKTVTLELFNVSTNAAIVSTTVSIADANNFSLALNKKIVLASTNTIRLRARTSNGTAVSNNSVITALKIN